MFQLLLQPAKHAGSQRVAAVRTIQTQDCQRAEVGPLIAGAENPQVAMPGGALMITRGHDDRHVELRQLRINELDIRFRTLVVDVTGY